MDGLSRVSSDDQVGGVPKGMAQSPENGGRPD
jgi:hypothetical protein